MADEDKAPDYVATPLKCWACEAKERAMADAREANKGRPLPGWYWSVEERVRRNGHGG